MLVLLVGLSNASGAHHGGYDPLLCNQDDNGHCNDPHGGAWKYRRKDGHCRHDEHNVPRATDLVNALPRLFPSVHSVLDFGGGPGGYLTGFRDAGVRNLVTVEPHPLHDCLFAGMKQLAIDIFTEPVNSTYDLIMTVEVAEHIPAGLHPQLIAWLISHTNRWIVFTAAHPGQPGEGHVANKSPLTWRKDFESSGVTFNPNATRAVKQATKASILQTNLHVFEKIRVDKHRQAATQSQTIADAEFEQKRGNKLGCKACAPQGCHRACMSSWNRSGFCSSPGSTNPATCCACPV